VTEHQALDDIDLKILSELQQDGRVGGAPANGTCA
jgi:DNA-binding Lrp family transcriptional regulator